MKKLVLVILSIFLVPSLTLFNSKTGNKLDSDFDSAYEYASLRLNGELDFTYLDSFNEENKFYLFETLNDSGYLIYDRVEQTHTEYAVSGSSPYKDIKDKGIYLMPTYYYSFNGTRYIDLMTNKILSESDTNELKRADTSYQKEIEEKKLEDLKREEKLKLEAEHAHAHTSKLSQRRNSTVYDSLIPNAFYFENLRDNYGDNEGTCTHVAAGMLLAYYDTTYDDNIIPEVYDVKGTIGEPLSSSNLLDPTTFTNSPGTNDEFHQKTIDDMGTLSMSQLQVEALINSYLNGAAVNYTYDSIAKHDILFIDEEQWVKDAIDTGNPVYMAVFNNILSIIGHAVVGYAYNADGIWAHFGWKSGTTANINAELYPVIVQATYYVLEEKDHEHILNYAWENTTNLTGTMCICGYVNCPHDYEYLAIDAYSHSESCEFCDYSSTHSHSYVSGTCNICGYVHSNHNFVNKGTINNHYKECSICKIVVNCSGTLEISSNVSSHTYSCSLTTCDFTLVQSHQMVNNVCSICGFSHTHNYDTYVKYNVAFHRSFCLCGVNILERHDWIYEIVGLTRRSRCRLCGQIGISSF